jgi:hypothetical protein
MINVVVDLKRLECIRSEIREILDKYNINDWLSNDIVNRISNLFSTIRNYIFNSNIQNELIDKYIDDIKTDKILYDNSNELRFKKLGIRGE